MTCFQCYISSGYRLLTLQCEFIPTYLTTVDFIPYTFTRHYVTCMIHSIASLSSGIIVILNDSLRNYSSTFWSHFWHFAYGNCYVFNGGTNESGLDVKVWTSNEPGPSYG